MESYISDEDENTKVKVEASPNEDVIRFEVSGTDVLKIYKNEHEQTVISVLENSNQGTTAFGYEAGVNNNPVSPTSGERTLLLAQVRDN